MTDQPSSCALKARIVFACIGTFVGLSILLMFGMVYKNWDAAIWGLASGVFAIFALIINLMYKRCPWDLQSSFLLVLMVAGLIAQLASIAATATYIAFAINEKQGLSPYGKAYYVAAVWSAMTWKWSFLLFIQARQYRNLQLNLSVQADPVF